MKCRSLLCVRGMLATQWEEVSLSFDFRHSSINGWLQQAASSLDCSAKSKLACVNEPPEIKYEDHILGPCFKPRYSIKRHPIDIYGMTNFDCHMTLVKKTLLWTYSRTSLSRDSISTGRTRGTTTSTQSRRARNASSALYWNKRHSNESSMQWCSAKWQQGLGKFQWEYGMYCNTYWWTFSSWTSISPTRPLRR